MKNKKYYSIGQVSNICKIPIKTLRYYDEMKILIPNVRKETSNYRYYEREQLTTAFMIRQLRQLGFNLKDIKEIISRDGMSSYTSYLEKNLEEIQAERDRLDRLYDENFRLLDRLKCGSDCLEDEKTRREPAELFRIEQLPQIALLKARAVCESYHNEEVNLERWIEIYEDAVEHHQEVSGPIHVTYHTEMFGQFFQKDCDIEFAVEVKQPETEAENVCQFGGFQAAVTTYCGPYSDIFKRYISLKRWIDEQGYEVCGEVTERFLISPIDTVNEKEHVTQILVPVKKLK